MFEHLNSDEWQLQLILLYFRLRKGFGSEIGDFWLSVWLNMRLEAFFVQDAIACRERLGGLLRSYHHQTP